MKYDITAPQNSHNLNAGGLCYFEFVPKEWLAQDLQFNIAANYVSTAVVLIAGKSWLKAICLPQSIGFSESQNITAAGQKFNQTLVGSINGDDLTTASLFNALPYHEYVIIYTGRNGEKKIIGTKQKGMRFNATLSTGTDYAGKHSYTLQFEFESAERAPYYLP